MVLPVEEVPETGEHDDGASNNDNKASHGFDFNSLKSLDLRLFLHHIFIHAPRRPFPAVAFVYHDIFSPNEIFSLYSPSCKQFSRTKLGTLIHYDTQNNVREKILLCSISIDI